MKKNYSYVPYLIGTCLLAFVACGSDDDDSGSGRTTGTTGGVQEEQEPIGRYRATLTPVPLNNSVAGSPNGTLSVEIEGDEFRATMRMAGVPSNIEHIQHIALGTSCPTASNDSNQDQFIDAQESATTLQRILIPLDANLDTQDLGINTFPFANSAGRYTWTRTASFSRLLGDLRRTDPDPDDSFAKLNSTNLNLAGRVVVVHGVKADANLPATVETIEDLQNFESLPIACGVIQRVSDSSTSGTGSNDTDTTTTTTTTTTGNTTDTPDDTTDTPTTTTDDTTGTPTTTTDDTTGTPTTTTDDTTGTPTTTTADTTTTATTGTTADTTGE